MKTQAVIRTAVRVGAVAGALCVAWILVLYATGQNPFGPKRLMSMFVPPVAVLLAEWQLRKRHLEAANFGRLLLTGLLCGVVVAALSAVGNYSLARLGPPALLQRNLAETQKILEASRKEFSVKELSQQAYEENKRALPVAAGTARGVANDDFQRKLLLGLLLSVPGAVFFRK